MITAVAANLTRSRVAAFPAARSYADRLERQHHRPPGSVLITGRHACLLCGSLHWTRLSAAGAIHLQRLGLLIRRSAGTSTRPAAEHQRRQAWRPVISTEPG